MIGEEAAWAAVRVPGRLQARFSRLVRKFGGPRNKGALKRAITAIARTLLKIACTVLKTGQPYADLCADSCNRRESPDARQDYLIRQLRKLNPGCVITITPRRPPDRGDRLITRPPPPREPLRPIRSTLPAGQLITVPATPPGIIPDTSRAPRRPATSPARVNCRARVG